MSSPSLPKIKVLLGLRQKSASEAKEPVGAPCQCGKEEIDNSLGYGLLSALPGA